MFLLQLRSRSIKWHEIDPAQSGHHSHRRLNHLQPLKRGYGCTMQLHYCKNEPAHLDNLGRTQVWFGLVCQLQHGHPHARWHCDAPLCFNQEQNTYGIGLDKKMT